MIEYTLGALYETLRKVVLVTMFVVAVLATAFAAFIYLQYYTESSQLVEVLEVTDDDIQTLKELKAEQCGKSENCSVIIQFQPEE